MNLMEKIKQQLVKEDLNEDYLIVFYTLLKNMYMMKKETELI